MMRLVLFTGGSSKKSPELRVNSKSFVTAENPNINGENLNIFGENLNIHINQRRTWTQSKKLIKQ
jgi:hypothetical protein